MYISIKVMKRALELVEEKGYRGQGTTYHPTGVDITKENHGLTGIRFCTDFPIGRHNGITLFLLNKNLEIVHEVKDHRV